MTPQQRLSEIEARLKAATPYEEKVGAKCPECNFETWGYRHWNGCELLDKHDNVLKNAPADIKWLTASLREALEVIEQSLAWFEKVYPGDVFTGQRLLEPEFIDAFESNNGSAVVAHLRIALSDTLASIAGKAGE